MNISIKIHDIWNYHLQCRQNKKWLRYPHISYLELVTSTLAKSSQTSLSSQSELLKNVNRVPPLAQKPIKKLKRAEYYSTSECGKWASRIAPVRSEEVKTQFRRKRHWQSHGRRTTQRLWFSVAAPLGRDGSKFSKDVCVPSYRIFVRRGFGQERKCLFCATSRSNFDPRRTHQQQKRADGKPGGPWQRVLHPIKPDGVVPAN